MEYILQTSGLSKRYGAIKAVDNLELSVPRGSVFGLLGPNGSGKSTTLGMILGITNPDAGNFQWFGSLQADAARKRLGALLEQPNFYGYLSAYNNLKLVAAIKEKGSDRIHEVLELVGLAKRKNSAFKTFSTGMKQRLALASTLLNDPEVIVLDEPTNGMDPKGIIEIRDLIKQLGVQGKTVILASHLLDEVEKVCTHVAVLKNGKLLETRQLTGITETTYRYAITANDAEALATLIKDDDQFQLVERSDAAFIIATALRGEEINSYCFGKGITLSELTLRKRTLEDQFLEITGDHA